jgi:hypothetical protein
VMRFKLPKPGNRNLVPGYGGMFPLARECLERRHLAVLDVLVSGRLSVSRELENFAGI